MTRYILTLIIMGLLFFTIPGHIYAQYGCQGQYGQYGGCPSSQSIFIDKLVSVPSSNSTNIRYVDNLSPSDPRFSPGSTVMFRLKVKNTSDGQLTGVTVKDFVPTYLNPIEGPGNFDSSNRVISFSAGDFAVNEEKIYDLKMQVAQQNDLPADKGLLCITNKSQAYTSNVSDDDTAQLCIEKNVLGLTQVPSTGPEFGLLAIAGELGLLGTGLILKKKLS